MIESRRKMLINGRNDDPDDILAREIIQENMGKKTWSFPLWMIFWKNLI